MSAEITERRARPSVQPGFTASIAASELLLFCRDLRSTVTEAVVIAAGRALASHPEVCRALQEEGIGVGVAVNTDSGLLVPVVRNAMDAPLPEVCAEVTHLVDAARAGGLSCADVGGAAVTVYALTPGGCGVAGAPTGCILTVEPTEPASVDLTLLRAFDEAQVDGAEARRFFATLTRLLQHPYRLLV